MRIAFATSSDHPELTADDRLAVAALNEHGAEVVPAIWSDRTADWPRFDVIVIRSTWDYHTKYDAFLAWLDELDSVGARVVNDTRTLRWNADTRYLRHFDERGIDVIPTTFSEQSRFEELLESTGVMVQPFVAEIETEGEWSFQFFGGVFSHAVLKRAQPGEYRVQKEHGGTIEAAVPPDHLLNEATRYIVEAPSTPDYARVDAVTVGGKLMLMELELIEPDLHFKYDQNAPARFSDRVLRIASSGSRAG